MFHFVQTYNRATTRCSHTVYRPFRMNLLLFGDSSRASNRMPLFARGGSVIPHYPIMQYVGEKKVEELELRCYHAQDKVRSELHEGSGDGYEYKKGQFAVQTFTYIGNGSHLTLRKHSTGKYKAEYDTFRVRFIGVPFTPEKVMLDDEPSELNPTFVSDGVWELVVPSSFEVIRLEGSV